MNRRVFLVNPPTLSEAFAFPLGLAVLAAVLRKGGYEVRVVDAVAPHNRKSDDQIKAMIKDFDPLFVGIFLMYDFVYLKYALAKEIQELGYPVIGGGPHANLLPLEVLEHGPDIVYCGEGEEAILEIAECLNKAGDLEDIKGIGLRRKDRSIKAPEKRPLIQDLDAFPFADYDDFPIKDYTGVDDYDSNKTFFNVFSSRGCPHRCCFCSSSRVWGPKYRWRSAKNVFDEIVHLREKYGANYFAFQDNEPLVNKKRMFELCDLLAESKLNVKISTRARIDNIDGDLLKRMMEVGFYKLAIGVESGDEDTLRKVNRRYTRKDIARSMETLRRIRFPIIHFNNLVGFPWENRKHFQNTLDMSRDIPKGMTYFVNVLTPLPLPATPLYEDYFEEYGFKEWWLDPEKQRASERGFEQSVRRPLFQFIMPRLWIDYMNSPFWRYSREVSKGILELQLRIQEIAYSRNENVSAFEIKLAFFLIRLSIFLHRLSPALESVLLAVFKNRFIDGISKKFVFKEQ